jgi:hypothetical protein
LKALLRTQEMLRRVHGSQKVILRDLPIKGGDQARETFRANHGINFQFLHILMFSLSGDAALIVEADCQS